MANVILVYWRHQVKDEEEYDSLEDALCSVEQQEDMGNIWAENILLDGVPLYRERKFGESFPPPAEV